MKPSFIRHAVVVFVAMSLWPALASADFLSAWARGHGSYIKGDQTLRYFENNDAGFGYGFALGAEVLQIDALVDVNFHPQGSQFNQIGLGFDMDLIPFEKVMLAPTAQALYFFGKHHDGADADRGLHARAGAQFGFKLVKFVWIGAEAFGGYMLALPEKEAGFMYSGAAFLQFKIDLL